MLVARSRKKTPIGGNAKASDKLDKAWANRRQRRVVRTCIAHDDNVEALPQKRELSDVWNFAKDGRRPYDRGAFAGKSLRK